MKYKSKKLLILAGAGPHCKVVETAKEMGIYTIVADNIPNSPAKTIADESLLVDIFDVEQLIAYGRKNNIDGVIDFCIDPAQKPAQEIAVALGLHIFSDSSQLISLTDKIAFKKLCSECGVDIIPEYSMEDVYSERVEFPVLVKPSNSRGSRGIAVCRNYDELNSAIPVACSESSVQKCIIEKYMDKNQDLTISYLVKDGEPVLVSLGDRYSGREEDNLNRQLVTTIQPSRYISMYLNNVDERVKKMIKHVGIKNGPVFMQGFVDGNTVRMYDPGVRFPGNEYERIHFKATGLNLMRSIISYAVGCEIEDYDGKLTNSYDLNGYCAIQYMVNVGPGRISRIEGLYDVLDNPYVIDVQQRHFVGDEIQNTGDIKHRAGEISIMVDRDADTMKKVIKDVQNQIHFFDDNNRNMLISPFCADKVTELYSDWVK